MIWQCSSTIDRYTHTHTQTQSHIHSSAHPHKTIHKWFGFVNYILNKQQKRWTIKLIVAGGVDDDDGMFAKIVTFKSIGMCQHDKMIGFFSIFQKNDWHTFRYSVILLVPVVRINVLLIVHQTDGSKNNNNNNECEIWYNEDVCCVTLCEIWFEFNKLFFFMLNVYTLTAWITNSTCWCCFTHPFKIKQLNHVPLILYRL